MMHQAMYQYGGNCFNDNFYSENNICQQQNYSMQEQYYATESNSYGRNSIRVPMVPDGHFQEGQDEMMHYKRNMDFVKFSYRSHPTAVARRNERERNRVKHINSTFTKLRQHLPSASKNKKMSKVDTLRSAIKYINHLQQILESQDPEATETEDSMKDSKNLKSSSADLLKRLQEEVKEHCNGEESEVTSTQGSPLSSTISHSSPCNDYTLETSYEYENIEGTDDDVSLSEWL